MKLDARALPVPPAPSRRARTWLGGATCGLCVLLLGGCAPATDGGSTGTGTHDAGAAGVARPPGSPPPAAVPAPAAADGGPGAPAPAPPSDPGAPPADPTPGDPAPPPPAPGDAEPPPADPGTPPPADPAPPPEPPPLPAPEGPGCRGYATRYWDCCKAHCGWSGNVPGIAPVTSCASDDTPQSGYDQPSSCGSSAASAGYTCFSMAPYAVSDTLSYGYAAVPSTGDVCGRCYRIDFDGTGHYDASDPGSAALAGHTMIVQATNIGYDVAGGQFDLLIPGGGVGAFNACSRQWGVSDAELGAQYGGFLTACRAAGGGHEAVRACVRSRCESVFDEPWLAELRAGCAWFVDWFHAADNPNLGYREVPCPAELVGVSGIDRRPLDDVATMCGPAGGGGGGGGGTCECDCAWAGGGATCGTDDGSCCWGVCCGR